MNFQHAANCQGTPESPCECIAGLWSVYFPAPEAKGGSGFLCTTHEPPLAATAPEVILDIYDGRAK